MRGQSRKVKVKFYSGYKGEETPRSVFIEDEEFPIDRVIDRKKILEPKTGEVRREFTITINERRAVLKISSTGECELIDLF
jgi:hypothetical protein